MSMSNKCSRGHKLTKKNTYVIGNRKRCRTCAQMHARRRRIRLHMQRRLLDEELVRRFPVVFELDLALDKNKIDNY